MKARRGLVLIVALALGAAIFIVWKRHIDSTVITVAPVAPKKIIQPPFDPEHPPAWIAPEPNPPAAQPGQVLSAIHEAMPQFPESLKRPVLLSKGQFRPTDTEENDVSGWAKIFQLPDGNYLARIETLWMQGTPSSLDVVLVRNPHPASAADLQDSITLGKLKALSGNMNFPAQTQGAAAARALVLLVPDERRIYAIAPLTSP